MFFEQKLKNISFFFFSENFQVLEEKFSIYLNRCVWVMQHLERKDYLEKFQRKMFKANSGITR